MCSIVKLTSRKRLPTRVNRMLHIADARCAGDLRRSQTESIPNTLSVNCKLTGSLVQLTIHRTIRHSHVIALFGN